MLVGVKTWAVAHLLRQWRCRRIILFGSVLAWAVYDRITLKHRSDPGDWRFSEGGLKNDIAAVVVASSSISRSASCSIPSWSGGTFSAHPHLEPDMSIHPTQSPSAQSQPAHKRVTATGHPCPQGLSPDRDAHVLPCPYGAHPRCALRRHPGRGFARHGDHGLETTIPVTLDMMILQGHAVMRGVAARAGGGRPAIRLLRDVTEQAFMTAARVLKETGCGAIKLEGGQRIGGDDPVSRRTRRAGDGSRRLTPQSVMALGGFKAQGRDPADWAPIAADARAVAEAGAFAVVLEALAEPLAAEITREIAIPTIGIGASPACDGQVLVLEDMLGLSPWVPKIRQALYQPGPGDRDRSRVLCGGGEEPQVPGAGARVFCGEEGRAAGRMNPTGRAERGPMAGSAVIRPAGVSQDLRSQPAGACLPRRRHNAILNALRRFWLCPRF